MHTEADAPQAQRRVPSLAHELASMRQQVAMQLPADVRRAMDDATAQLVASGQIRRSLQPGQRIVDFVLPDALAQPVASMALRARGPLLITFYRGEWCPYCNLALRALLHKHALAFPVLSDRGNVVARSFGLVFALPPALRPVYAALGHVAPGRAGRRTPRHPCRPESLSGRHGTPCPTGAASRVPIDPLLPSSRKIP